MLLSRGVVHGGADGAMAPPDFGRSVNPTSNRGTEYAHLITTATGTPGFSNLPTALLSINDVIALKFPRTDYFYSQ